MWTIHDYFEGFKWKARKCDAREWKERGSHQFFMSWNQEPLELNQEFGKTEKLPEKTQFLDGRHKWGSDQFSAFWTE